METKINPNGLAIFNTLKDNQGKVLAFAEIAALAGIDAKTGYLTSAKKIAKENSFEIVKVEDGVETRIMTETAFPSGLTLKTEKVATIDGYKLAPKGE